MLYLSYFACQSSDILETEFELVVEVEVEENSE